MEFAIVLRSLWQQKRVLMLGVVVSVLAAISSVYRLDILGASLEPIALQYSSASTQVIVDTPTSSLGDLRSQLQPLVARATIVANVMASPASVSLIGNFAGIPGDQIYAAGPIDPLLPRTVTEPTASKRNVEITGETKPYRLQILADANLPTIGIFTQAPTNKQALALANGAVRAIGSYLETLQSQESVPVTERVTVRPLGQPTASVVDGGISKKLAAIVAVAVFAFWCVLMLIAQRFRENWRASGVQRTKSSGPITRGVEGPPSGTGDETWLHESFSPEPRPEARVAIHAVTRPPDTR